VALQESNLPDTSPDVFPSCEPSQRRFLYPRKVEGKEIS